MVAVLGPFEALPYCTIHTITYDLKLYFQKEGIQGNAVHAYELNG
jgi:hypothetical protein